MKYDKMLLTPWQVNDSAATKMVQIGGSALTNSELISIAVGITPDCNIKRPLICHERPGERSGTDIEPFGGRSQVPG